MYTAAHLSLAVLEVLVHTGDRVKLLDYHLIRLEIPAEHLEVLSPHILPGNWPEQLETTRELGREWLAEARSLALVVPSVVIPEEENVLLNPAHPAMGEVEASAPEPFRFDPRLKSRLVTAIKQQEFRSQVKRAGRLRRALNVQFAEIGAA